MERISREDVEAIMERDRADPEDVRAMLARVPPSWSMIQDGAQGNFIEDGGAFRRGSIQVLFTLSRESDGELWVHVSACGRTGASKFHLPTWEDMKRVKNDFIGEDAWAYQVFPSAKDYINQHPCVLHLFARLDGKPALPDFTKGTGGI